MKMEVLMKSNFLSFFFILHAKGHNDEFNYVDSNYQLKALSTRFPLKPIKFTSRPSSLTSKRPLLIHRIKEKIKQKKPTIATSVATLAPFYPPFFVVTTASPIVATTLNSVGRRQK